ncbi:hypothetical protein D3C72_1842810 [compost metagenome]
MVANCAISPLRRSQRTSGWRRTIPEAEHGASSKMASNCCTPWRACTTGSQVFTSSALATTTSAARPRRCKVPSMRSARFASISSATTSKLFGVGADSSRCAVLPPGAAQASSTCSVAPSCGSRPLSNSGAAICAALSCTDTQPSAKCGKYSTGTALARMMPASPTPAIAATPACSSNDR